MDAQKKAGLDPCLMKARDMRFEYAEKVLSELGAFDNKEFKLYVSAIRSLTASLKSLDKYPEDLMYQPVIYFEKIALYGSKLLSSINSLYKLVYDTSIGEIRRVAEIYITAIVDSKGGEIFSNKEYYEEYKKASEQQDGILREQMLKYLRHDILVLKDARKEFYAKHQEYAYALKDRYDSRDVQTMQAIFLIKELFDFGDIKFDKFEEWLDLNKAYIEKSTKRHVDEVKSTISELNEFRQYMLSLPVNGDFPEDIEVELKLHGMKLRR